jgi:hypothetical protein
MSEDTRDEAPPEGGSYEVIRQRLLQQSGELVARTDALNKARRETFGGSDLALLETVRVRTDNACVPRDILNVAGHLLFGFHVVVGIRSETTVGDVLSLHQLQETPDGVELHPAEPSVAAFLSDDHFVRDFGTIFRYAREARLLQLRRTEQRLLLLCQTGPSQSDVKVFRFAIASGGRVTYLDARGEEDNKLPDPYDFTWLRAGRDRHVHGKHPHINILDTVFLTTAGGALAVKIENNTDHGAGIYRDAVDEPNQSLDDLEVHYARLDRLLLLKIRPYREKDHRYLVYNELTRKVTRIDRIALGCRKLPEDQGIVFPGGYYLQTGEEKIFDLDIEGMYFDRVAASPNGEDTLYVFHRRGDGAYVLFSYNGIQKEVAKPLVCHGYCLFDDGRMLVFHATSDEPTKIHPMQVWKTPFQSAEHAAAAPTQGSYLSKIGNAALVRGISEAYTIRRLAEAPDPTRQTYEDLVAALTRALDTHHWLNHPETFGLGPVLSAMRKTSELVVDEFERALATRARAAEALAEGKARQAALLDRLRVGDMADLQTFVGAMAELRRERGRLAMLRDVKGIDRKAVEALDEAVAARFDEVGKACAGFLLGPEAFTPLAERFTALSGEIERVTKAIDIGPLRQQLEEAEGGVTLLDELINGLAIEDAIARTRILDGLAEIYAQLNRTRALLDGRRKDLASAEARGEFSAQFRLLGQAISGAVARCDTPERCDEELSRLLLQIEELEGKFGEFDEFVTQLAERRDEIADAIGARRQSLVDERQRRVGTLLSAAQRMLSGIQRRAGTLAQQEELLAYFASDGMVLKLRQVADQIEALGDTTRSEELRGRLKAAQQEALRTLRDRQDLGEGGENTLKLGAYRFAINTRPLELTVVQREGSLALHLPGTDFFEPLSSPELDASADLWDQELVSETPEVYRAEFLAASLLFDAQEGRGVGSEAALLAASLAPGGLLELVRKHASERYDEGYERGVHDHDATLLLERILSLLQGAGLLRVAPRYRAMGCALWASLPEATQNLWHLRARSLGRLRSRLGGRRGHRALVSELTPIGKEALEALGFSVDTGAAERAVGYLLDELAAEHPRFLTSHGALHLRDDLLQALDEGERRALEGELRALQDRPRERLALCMAWLEGYLEQQNDEERRRVLEEAAVLLAFEGSLERESCSAVTRGHAEGLLGRHPRIHEGTIQLRLDEFLDRLGDFARNRAPRFRAYRALRQRVIEEQRGRLRLDELKPQVLSSFVRNRLVDEVYLPLIGANLAKQLGALGEGKRTDLMGLLLLVSPPGYGKTTLMEYVAARLGLAFVKVNGPALGHDVRSIDPADAPSATARQEVERINLALEMGNNVMLYLDDIQHTNPELLQKFISLCDAQRKIEGVWRGRSRTYDLRGKRFCVVMAGNPYTETGEKFRIPDMLANRADTYNLGDILHGREKAFAQSYLENALTSNPTLAPLAARDRGDLDRFFRAADGDDVPLDQFVHNYSAAEYSEILAVLRHLTHVQSVLLRVNQQYIASASQEDAYRTEPPFKLQGSYRNMNKLAEKVVSAMNQDELERLIDDHYASESQTLTTGAEQNLLKLAELRGRLSPEQRARWDEIKQAFARARLLGGDEDDPASRVVGALALVSSEIEDSRKALLRTLAQDRSSDAWAPLLDRAEKALARLARPELQVQLAPLDATPLPEILQNLIALVGALAQTPREAPRPPDLLGPQLAQIMAKLKHIEESLASGGGWGPSPPLFDVELGPNTPSNLYRGLEGGGVVDGGGVFVATYGRLPAHGSRVRLKLRLPGSEPIETTGTVTFLRDPKSLASTETIPGFGVRLTAVSTELSQKLLRFAGLRAPLFHDG